MASFTAFLAVSKPTTSSVPTDEEMITKYTQHKSEFNQLAQTLVADTRIKSIRPSSNACIDFDQQRIAAETDQNCAKLVKGFNSLGIKDSYGDNDTVYFVIATAGLSVSGIRRGYVYTIDPISFHSRKEIVEATGKDCQVLPCYRQIDDNWYVYLDDWHAGTFRH